MSKLNIRPLQQADFEAVNGLFEQVDRIHREWYPRRFRKAEPSREASYLEGLITDPQTDLLVAVWEGQVAGMLLLFEKTFRDHPLIIPQTFALLDVIVVDEAFRRKGIGQALFAEAKSWAKARNLDRLEIHVYDKNQQALSFYKKLGFLSLKHELEMRIEL